LAPPNSDDRRPRHKSDNKSNSTQQKLNEHNHDNIHYSSSIHGSVWLVLHWQGALVSIASASIASASIAAASIKQKVVNVG